VSVTIYLEGGGESRDLHIRCREGSRKLFERCGFLGRMPKLVACGGRSQAFKDFLKAFQNVESDDDIVLLLVDSEDPMTNIEETWRHLKNRDNWDKPEGATDEQVLMMTTCMETWIVADREALNKHYGSDFQESALPSLVKLEDRNREEILSSLEKATKNCPNKFQKGKRSFQVLAVLTRETLESYLPSFVRDMRILESVL
jgi:hypothetical protein